MKKKFKKLHITQTKEYELTQSPFFKLYSIEKLLNILKIEREILEDILNFPGNYYTFKTSNGRNIQTPSKDLSLYLIQYMIMQVYI